MIRESLWEEGMKAWTGLADFRADRERNKRYTYGRQWDDVIEVEGSYMTEAAYLRSQGSVPLKNNLIRRLVRNVLGVWRSEFRLPTLKARDSEEAKLGKLLNKLLACNAQSNRLEELYARTMEEFLISGLAIHRKSYGLLRGRMDCRTDYVHPANFFFTSDGCDFRGWDLSMVGELHNTTLGSVELKFGLDAEAMERLAHAAGAIPGARDAKVTIMEIWREEGELYYVWHDRESGKLVRMPANDNQGSEKLDIPKETEVRREWRRVWKYSFLGPGGIVLKEGISPYSHGSHPYVVRFYPYIDGEVHSFVADVIDQQRYTNRLITMYDWVMRASAKGVLLFPEGSLPEDTDLEEIADEWSRFNGVITYRAKAGMPAPQQVSSTGAHGGITDLLNIQLQMFEDISGVNSALQGKLESSSVSGTLFSQQTQNAMTSLRDLIASYREFVLEGTMKDACNLLKFYSREKMSRIAGAELSDLRDTDLSRFSSPDLDFSF